MPDGMTVETIKKTNMELWDKVKTSDPKSLKEVSYGARHFTAISAYHQILKATETWGPVGKGWGWFVLNHMTDSIPQHPDLCTVGIRIWYKGNISGGFPIFGSCKWMGKGGIDHEAPKKALTDAITKGLSYLGFNADIFLQELKWDGDKYVGAKPRDNVDWAKTGDKLENFTNSVKLRNSFVDAMGLVDNKVGLDAWAEEVSAAVQAECISEKDKDILNKLYKTKHGEFK